MGCFWPVRFHQAEAEQNGQHRSKSYGKTDIRFDQHVEVNDSSGGGHINQLVQSIPALSSKPADPIVGGCYRQRDEQEVAGHTDCDKGTFGNILNCARQVEPAVKPDISNEMQRAIKEGEQAKHSPKLDQ